MLKDLNCFTVAVTDNIDFLPSESCSSVCWVANIEAIMLPAVPDLGGFIGFN